MFNFCKINVIASEAWQSHVLHLYSCFNQANIDNACPYIVQSQALTPFIKNLSNGKIELIVKKRT